MISIIIPCRNERNHIGPLLDSLRTQKGPSGWEAIIADGMSNDGTRAVIEAYMRRDPRIRMIDNPGGIVSTGLNAAIRESRGEIILRMDAHTEYASDYIAQCVHALQCSGADNVGGPARTRAAGIVQRAVAAAYHSRFCNGGAKFHDDSYSGDADTVPYGCWRRSTLERVGFFDESMVRNQDDELNLRLIRMGGRIWQSSQIVSWYRPRTSLRDLARQYFQYGYWKVEVIRKHRLPASWRHLVPGTFVLANVVLPAGAAAAFAAGMTAPAKTLAELWMAAGGLYLAGCLAAAVATARKRGWDLMALLPLVFATYHFSYGAGFLANALRSPFARAAEPRKLFTSLSR